MLRKEFSCAVKGMTCTADGTKIAISDGGSITIRCTTENKTLMRIARANISKLALSPDGNILVTYELFKKTAEFPEGLPNLTIYDLQTGAVLDSRIHVSGENWRPQWSVDNNLCIRFLQGQIHFFTNNSFDEKPVHSLSLRGVRHCTLARSPINRNLALYVPSEKNNPGMVHVYAWRSGACVSVANKSFFRADTASFFWSDTGASLLILAATKTSTTSYYGEQTLHFVTTTKSGDSASVPMPRKGPIHQVLWKPSGLRERPSDERFVVCQGTIPSIVAVFNIKCELLFSLGTGAFNSLYFNCQGNTLLLAGGFGSLNGFATVWDFNSKSKLSEFSAPNTTYIAWLPDGEHLIAAITTPRLRFNNGFAVRRYTGEIVAAQAVEPRAVPRAATVDIPAATEHELYQVLVKPVPFDELPPPPVPHKSGPGSGKPVVSKVDVEKPKAYIPPALRNQSATAAHSAAVQSSRADANLNSANHMARSGPIGGIAFTGGGDGAPKATGRKRKPKSQRGLNAENSMTPTAGAVSQSLPTTTAASPLHSQPTISPQSDALTSFGGSGGLDPQKQKSYILKKLAEIEKLKILQKTKKLEVSQLEKMAREEHLRVQLTSLQL